VVPAQSQDLFEPLEKDGKLYGRWCWDMKDGCAIIILLMKKLLEEWYTQKKVSLRLTTDEEVWWIDGVWALVNDGRSWKIVLIPDAGDYTYVTYASKWIITVNLEVCGKAAHSSRPWMWDNALEKVYTIYQTIKQKLEDPEILYNTEERRSPSVQLTKCHGWIASNVLPEKALATINIRFTEQRTQESLLSLIQDVCEEYQATILTRESWPLMHTDVNNPYLLQFVDIVKDVTWQQPGLDKEHGTTDGRYFPPETTVLLYQPTDNHIHTAGEYTTVDQLEDVYNIYTLFVRNVEI
jgi:succinyl-diaminopimelate desuccinylase